MYNSTASTTTTSSIIPLLQTINKYLNFYGVFFILIPGFVLNVLAFLLFMRKRFWHHTNMGFFYSLEALFNNCSVMVGIIVFLSAGVGHDLQLVSSTWCQILILARTQVIQFASYYTILISFDRTMNIVFRRPILFFAKYRNICLIIVLIWLGVAASNTIQWWRYVRVVSVTNNNVTTNVSSCTGDLQTLMGSSFVGVASRIIPTVANITMNCMIIRTLAKFNSEFRIKAATRRDSTTRLSAKDISFVFSLLALNFIFIILTLPNTVLNIIQIYNYFVEVSAETVTEITLLMNFGAWSSYLNCCLPFLINLVFNRTFRSEILNILNY